MTGRLVRDPLLRNTSTGTMMAFFTLAANQRYKDKHGTQQEETAFVKCKAFGGWAEPLANCHKGEAVLVAGRLRTETWEKDGNSESELFLICECVHPMLPSRKSNGSASPNVPPEAETALPAAVKKAVPF
jgi:single-strand DNA-binding protein